MVEIYPFAGTIDAANYRNAAAAINAATAADGYFIDCRADGVTVINQEDGHSGGKDKATMVAWCNDQAAKLDAKDGYTLVYPDATSAMEDAADAGMTRFRVSRRN